MILALNTAVQCTRWEAFTAARVTVSSLAMTLLADLPAFIVDHGQHGALTGEATEPTANGYMVSVRCSCGVVYVRWVTPSEAALELVCQPNWMSDDWP